jgi:hypothetical protein
LNKKCIFTDTIFFNEFTPLGALYILWLVIIVVPQQAERQKVAKVMDHVHLTDATHLRFLIGYQT